MNKMLRKVVSGAMALCMVAGMGAVSAFAAGPYADGTYTADFAARHESKDQASMCNQMFCKTADIVIKDGKADISLFAANPVPAFPTQGADGTVKDVVLTLNGVDYEAVSDMDTKPERKFVENGGMFGIHAGDVLPCQVVTFKGVPADQLDALYAAPAKTVAFVNVVMNQPQTFRLQLYNIQKVEGAEPQPQPETPEATETSRKGTQITANVAAPEAKYSVTIPESIDMGTLSTEEDNVTPYTVGVTAENLGNGKVVVSAPAQGALNSAENTLAYTNGFGTQETSVTASLEGRFSVSAEAVKAAVAGSYAGTTTFTISYYAAQ